MERLYCYIKDDNLQGQNQEANAGAAQAKSTHAAPREHRQEQGMVKRALGQTPRMIRSSPAADKGIDRLVYELYGLTEDEIKIVES